MNVSFERMSATLKRSVSVKKIVQMFHTPLANLSSTTLLFLDVVKLSTSLVLMKLTATGSNATSRSELASKSKKITALKAMDVCL